MSIHSEKGIASANIVGRKALITKSNEVETLFKQFFGKPMSVPKPRINQRYQEPLVLSLYEALYLCKKGVISVKLAGEDINCNTLEKYCESLSHNFKAKYKVYEYLKDRNYIIRGGIKYGADFSVYTVGPGYEHAPYVITVVPRTHRIRPTDIVALGRVSHSVKKRSVLAIVDEQKDNISYIVFKWIKL